MTLIRIQDGSGSTVATISFPTYDHAHDFFADVEMPADWTSQTLSDDS